MLKKTNPIRVYIVEDVAISRMSLETMLLENQYQLSGSAAKAEIAWKEIQITPTDLVLLDINLAGEKNGIWLAQQIRTHLHLPIVYLTAYGDEQTLQEVLDTKPDAYLMKPYQEPALLATINIALNNFDEKQKEVEHIKTTEKEYLFIKESYTQVKLKIQDIHFIKSEGNYLDIYLAHKTHVIRKKLSDFLELLPQDSFLQCHRRYIINSKRIEIFGKDYLQLHGKKIPVSPRYRNSLEKTLGIN